MKKIVPLIVVSLLSISCSKPTSKDVIKAIDNDDITRFQSLREEITIDTLRFAVGETVFHYAYQAKANHIMQQLIEEEILLNEADSLGYTPLLALIQDTNPQYELIEKLLDKEIDINAIENYNGYSSLHYAVYNSQPELVKKLLAKGANPNIQVTSLMKSTPLHIAIEKKDKESIRYLIEKTSDTIKDYNDKTVLALAIRSKDVDIQKIFYHKMAVKDKRELFANLCRFSDDVLFLDDLLDQKWITRKLLNKALVFVKNTSIAKKLLDKGAQINYLHEEYKYGAIHYAAVRGNVTMLKFLLENGANINQLSKDKTMSVVMHAAQLYENFNAIDKKGASMGIGLTQTALDFFANSKDKTKENSLEAVKFLVAKKANLHFKNKFNANALYYAEASKNSSVAEYLKTIGVKETKKYSESKSGFRKYYN